MADINPFQSKTKVKLPKGRYGEINQALIDEMANNAGANAGLLDAAMGINQFLPVTGDIQSGLLAGRDLGRGDYKSAALNSLGLLPFIPSMGGVIKKVDKVSDIGRYAMAHRAPMKDSGAPLHDLTGGGSFYPDDVYSSKAAQYYGDGMPYDNQAFSIARGVKDNPDALVTMYRAVPKNTSLQINNGDWVTLSKQYAKEHGYSHLDNNYKILSKKVPARKLFTNGDSIHEFGYDESGKISQELLPLLGGAGLLGAGGVNYLSDKK